jgi:hypothetical protein
MLLAGDGAERQRVLRNHLLVRLAGQAAEMEFTFMRFRATGHQVNKTRWRTRWIRNLLYRNDVDVDFTFAALCGWGLCRNVFELRQSCEELWRQTASLICQQSYWLQVEILAAVLEIRPVMSGKEAFAVIRPLAP